MSEETDSGIRVSGPNDQNRSVGELVHDLSEQLSRLVRDEMRLAVLEMQRKTKRFGMGAGLSGVAAFLAVVAVLTLVAAAVLGLATVMPAWLAALIVAAGLLLIAGIAGMAGKRQLNQATPPVPTEALASAKRDVEVVQQRVHS